MDAAAHRGLPAVTMITGGCIGPGDVRVGTGSVIVGVVRGLLTWWVDGTVNLVDIGDVVGAHLLAAAGENQTATASRATTCASVGCCSTSHCAMADACRRWNYPPRRPASALKPKSARRPRIGNASPFRESSSTWRRRGSRYRASERGRSSDSRWAHWMTLSTGPMLVRSPQVRPAERTATEERW